MRSSIACVRCRRSKVKCVNNGAGTTCRACDLSGRDCQYPPPAPAGSRRGHSQAVRAEAASHGTTASAAVGSGGGGGGGGGGGDSERRPRKMAHSLATGSAYGLRTHPRPLIDALDASILSPDIWQDLFDIFQIHYSADLPFLHKATFLKPLRFARPSKPTGASDSGTEAKFTFQHPRPPASAEFLLAFLALTARFHPRLIAHHSPPTYTRDSNPLIASEYYASAANQSLTGFWIENRKHDIEFTQACLMLGLHEWGMCRGAKAWILAGMAIRSAQAMGLQYEMDLDDEPLSRSFALNADVGHVPNWRSQKNSVDLGKSRDDLFIEQEIRRRTFWSCFIMDRYLSSGKYRPQMLHAKELRIQLPASENSFAFAEKVRTLLLGEDDRLLHVNGRAEVQSHRQLILGASQTPEPHLTLATRRHDTHDDSEDDKGKLEAGSDEGLVSRYIKILEIYGRVIKWSCAGGRRTEEFPPWDEHSTFYRLLQQCREFKATLPRQHQLSPKNTQAHISMKTSTPYILVHVVYLLCQIMLHREYVPFVAIRCNKPCGPLDPPLFPPDRYPVPPGFWEDSARECFKSAREVVDLVRTSQEWNSLVETPIVGFAIYVVAFTGNYCISFPWMDPDGYMCTPAWKKSSVAQTGHSHGFLAARKALEMIGSMKPRMYMAVGWFRTVIGAFKYYAKMKKDYNKNIRSLDSSSAESDSPESARHVSLRDGGAGGGLDEYKSFERTLQDFGNLEDHDIEMTDMQSEPNQRLDTLYDESSAENTANSEDMDESSGSKAAASPVPPKAEIGSWSAINAASNCRPGYPETASAPMNGQFRSYDSYSQPPPAPPPPPSQSHSYAHPRTSFHPAPYPQDGPPSASAPPGLTSPTSHSATTSSQQSPSFERPPSYNGWTPHNLSYTAPTPPQQHQQLPPIYPNGFSPHQPGGAVSTQPAPLTSPTSAYHPAHPNISGPNAARQHLPPLAPMHGGPGAATPTSNAAQHPPPPPPPPPPPQAPLQPSPPPSQTMTPAQPTSAAAWDAMAKEAWLDSMDTRFGADDLAAFANGGNLEEWAGHTATEQGFPHGWLSTIWGLGGESYVDDAHQHQQQQQQQHQQLQQSVVEEGETGVGDDDGGRRHERHPSASQVPGKGQQGQGQGNTAHSQAYLQHHR